MIEIEVLEITAPQEISENQWRSEHIPRKCDAYEFETALERGRRHTQIVSPEFTIDAYDDFTLTDYPVERATLRMYAIVELDIAGESTIHLTQHDARRLAREILRATEAYTS